VASLTKRHLLTALAASQGISVSQLRQRCPVDHSVFYRVFKGEKRSARVDAFLAQELGLTAETMDRLNGASRCGSRASPRSVLP